MKDVPARPRLASAAILKRYVRSKLPRRQKIQVAHRAPIDPLSGPRESVAIDCLCAPP
jgi:hypothetical protein